MPGFERTGGFIFAPGGKQVENKFRRMAVWKDRVRRINFKFFAGVEKFAERPALAVSEIVQGKFIAAFRRNFPPPFIKHCQLGNAAVTCCQADLHGH